MVTFIDLFSGCGGLSLGLKRAGLKLIEAYDYDSDAIKTFNMNFKGKGKVVDIHNLTLKEGAAEVLVAGLPCQGFSSSGKRNENDPRNKLWEEFFRLVQEVQPKVALIENVPPFLKSKDGNALIESLESVGYEVHPNIHNAADFGVPQNRKRVIIMASKVGAPVEIKKASKKVTVRDAFKRLPLKPNGKKDHDERKHSGRTLERFKCIPEGGNRFDLPERLKSPCWRRRKTGFSNMFGRIKWDEPSNTIRTNFQHPECGRFIHPSEHRGLTIREGARLQGFPDNFKFFGAQKSKARQIGNAVPPKFGVAVGKSVLKTLRASKRNNTVTQKLIFRLPLSKTSKV